MSKKYPNITKEFLYEEYWTKGNSQIKIAKICGCSPQHICQLMASYGITAKDRNFNIDLTGRVVEKLTVLYKDTKKTSNGCNKWICRCVCGKEKSISSTALIRANVKSCGQCRAFGCVPGTQYCAIKTSAKKRGIDFNVSREYLWKLFLEQDRRCAYTNIEIEFAQTRYDYCHGKTTASLDRKDNTKGYIEGNVQWVHKKVNQIKMDLTEMEFINFCKKVAEKFKDD